MLWFAYDGSLNGDWLSHYAVRFAQHLPERHVHLLHVEDGSLDESQLSVRLRLLRKECERAELQLSTEYLEQKNGVAQALLERLPAGPHTHLLCGARIRRRKLAFLSGTVSEKLLKAHHCNVLAVRVIQPGAFGVVNNLLLPVTGHPRGAVGALRFVKLIGTDLRRVQILLVKPTDPRSLPQASAANLIRSGWDYVHRIEHELRTALPQEYHLDGSVVVSDDPASEVVVAAQRQASQFILLGATERSLASRLLSTSPIERVLHAAPCDVGIYWGFS
jgi:nucleotide-binding universal stress UspA family protein